MDKNRKKQQYSPAKWKSYQERKEDSEKYEEFKNELERLNPESEPFLKSLLVYLERTKGQIRHDSRIYLLNRHINCRFGSMKIIIKHHPGNGSTLMEEEKQDWSAFPKLDPNVQIWSIPINKLKEVYTLKYSYQIKGASCREKYDTKYRNKHLCTYSHCFRVEFGKPESEIHNPIEELTYFAFYHLKNGNYLEAIPHLVVEFAEYYPNLNLEKKLASNLMDSLYDFMKAETINPYFVYYALALIGVLPLETIIKPPEIKDLLKLVIFELIDIVPCELGILNHKFTEKIETGLVMVMIMNMKMGDDTWKRVFEYIENPHNKLLIIEKFAKTLNEVNLQAEIGVVDYLVDLLCELKLEIPINILKNIYHLSPNFRFFYDSLKENEKVFLIERVEKLTGKETVGHLTLEEFKEWVIEYTENKVFTNLKEIPNFLEFIHSKTEILKLLKEAELPSKLNRKLLNPLPKTNFKYFELYVKILQNLGDFLIISEFDLRSIYSKFLNVQYVYFSELINWMNVPAETTLYLMREWLELMFKNPNIFPASELLELEVQIQNIPDEEIQTSLYKEVMNFCFKLQEKDFIDLSDIVSECSPSMQKEYLRKIVESNNLEKFQKIFKKKKEEKPENKLFKDILWHFIVKKRKNPYVYEEVKKFLLENPEKGKILDHAIEFYELYYENPNIVSLINHIHDFTMTIIMKECPILVLIKIDRNETDKKESLFYFIEAVLKIKCSRFWSRFQENFDGQMQEINRLNEKIESIRKFLYKFCFDSNDFYKFQEYFVGYESDYYEKGVKNLKFPEELEEISNEVMGELVPILNSHLIYEVYLPELKSQIREFSTYQVLEFTKDSQNKMIEEFRNLCSFESTTIKVLEKREQHIDLFIKDIPILQELTKIEFSKIEKLLSLLENFINIPITTHLCKELNTLNTLLLFCDPNLIKISEEYLTYCKANFEELSIDEFLTYSEQLEKYIEGERNTIEKELVRNIVIEIAESSELVQFIFNITENELDYMKEGVNNYEEGNYVNTQTIFDLENLWNYLKDLRGKSTYSELAEAILDKEKLKANKMILYQLKNCNNELFSIKELYIDLYCHEEAKKNQIEEIWRSSSYTITYEKTSGYNVFLKYEKNTKHDLKIATLLELRERAQLIWNSSTFREENSKIFERFIELVDILFETLKILNELHSEGSPEIKYFDKEYFCIEGSFHESLLFKNELSNKLSEWKKALKAAYESNKWLTMLHGRQFWIIEDFFSKKNMQKRKKTLSLLEYMRKKSLDIVSLENTEGVTIAERLQKLGDFIKILPKRPPNYSKSDIKAFIKTIEIFENEREILVLKNTNLAKSIISLYLNQGLNIPNLNEILYCGRNTRQKELVAFLYRCFNFPSKLHVLVNCEDLPIEQQEKFIELFKELAYLSHYQHFKLALIVYEKNSILLKYFKYSSNLSVKKIIDSQLLSDEIVENIIKELSKNCFVMKSEKAGLGKTTKILQKAKRENKIPVHFFIAGELNIDTVYARLEEIELRENCMLVLQIAHVDNTILLNRLLFDIVVFRSFCTSNGMIEIPEICPIVIEVANTFNEELLKSLTFLSYLKEEHILIFELESLILNEDPALEYIANYLHLFNEGRLDQENALLLDGNVKYKVPSNRIKELLQNYFLNSQIEKREDTNYIQLSIFLKILYGLLKNFSFSPFSTVETTQIMTGIKSTKSDIRSRLFESLLITTREFTTKSIKQVKNSQNNTLASFIKKDVSKPLEEELLNLNCCLTWEESNHFTLIFRPDGTILPIYKYEKEVPEPLKTLLFEQECLFTRNYTKTFWGSYKFGNIEITDYSTLSHSQLLEKMNTYSNHHNLQIEYGNSSYVMTPDNFLKMNLIKLRIDCGVPVVIMGETGCGKTSLIRFLAENILKDQLIIFSIHAGITTEHILRKMEEFREISNKLQENNSMKKLWVFFDEFNTSDAIGVICEIICNRKLFGQILPENMAFLAACNPYKLKNNSEANFDNVGIKKSRKINNENASELVHIVKPLPDTIIEYVWDFGALTRNDQRIYISEMLKNVEIEQKNLFVELINCSQNYFQEKDSYSSVSLRDVSRFIILYEWFKSILQMKKNLTTSEQFRYNLKKYRIYSEIYGSVEYTSGILALCHCYYLRISSQEERKEYLKILEKESGGEVKIFIIERILKNEKYDIMARMELPEGTALNQALTENIFAIIPCIINKIPIFICGKPGCSKSLAIELVFSNLRGRRSVDPLFQQFPELIMVPFQGSLTCTSEGVEKVFEKAKKYIFTKPELKEERKEGEFDNLLVSSMSFNKNSVLPVVVFDEVGLAELSKNNPLKVLHNLLELENRVVGFIGISNWRLDDSKMNRVLYIARPDPVKEDLILTAKSIFNTYCPDNTLYCRVIKSLTEAYFRVKNIYEKTKYADVYGLRDFYHLIKYVSRCFKEYPDLDNKGIISVVKKAIERNFGGNLGINFNAIEEMCAFFSEIYKCHHEMELCKNYRIWKLCKENLAEKESRYLMLIGNGEVATYFLEKKLEVNLTDKRIIIGSPFEGDENVEEYLFKSLRDIILYMENGVSVILKDMDYIYSSLYDLFNEHFVISGDKKYCRITIGTFFNPRCFVHPDFNIIVLMKNDENTILSQDGPFLSRFEKHQLEIENILKKEQKEAVEEIGKWVETIIKTEGNKLPLLNFFPTYSKDSISLFVLGHSDKTKAVTACKQFLLNSAPVDILILSEFSSLEEKEKIFIKGTWKTYHRLKFMPYIRELKEFGNNKKILVLSYDDNLEDVLRETNVMVRGLKNYNSERELRKDFEIYFLEQNCNLLVIHIDFCREGKYMEFLKSVYEKVEAELGILGKNVCIVAHMMRNFKYEHPVPFLEGWEVIFLDSLSENPLIIDEELEKTNKKLILEDKILVEMIKEIICKFNYTNKNEELNHSHIKNHIDFIFENIDKDNRLLETLKTKTDSMMNKQTDWKKSLISDNEIIKTSKDTMKAIENTIKNMYKNELMVILFLIETENSFESFFTQLKKQNNEILKGIWIENVMCLETENIIIEDIIENTTINFVHGLSFPFIQSEYENIKRIFKEYEQEEEKTRKKLVILNIMERTILGKFLISNENSKQIQKEYVKNLIRMFTLEYLVSEDTECLAYKIFKSLTSGWDNFLEEILFLFENMKMLINICRIMIKFELEIQSFSIEQFKKDLEQIKKVTVLTNSDDENSLDEEEENSKENEENQKEQISSLRIQNIASIIDNLIWKVFPTEEMIEEPESLELYANFLDTLLKNIFELDIEFANFEALYFWMHLLRFIERGNCEISFLYETAEKASENSENETCFLYKQEFKEFFIHRLENNECTDEYALQKLKCTYFKFSIKELPEIILEIAYDFEVSDSWKYSTEIIEILVENSKLVEIIEEIDEETTDLKKFYIESNEILDMIERALKENGLESNFGILLCDYIANDYIKEIEDANLIDLERRLEIGWRGFEHFIEVVSSYERIKVYPFLNGLIGVIIVRVFLEIYILIYMKEKQTEIDFKTHDIMAEIRKTLKKSYIATVLQLFCTKRLIESKMLNFSELPDFFRKNEWTENMFEIGINKNLEFILFEYQAIISSRYRLEAVEQYNTVLQEFCEKSMTSDYLKEERGVTRENINYENLKLFRLIREPSLEIMEIEFENISTNNRFKLLKVYFENKEDFCRLSYLDSIIQFTNSLLDLYNHRISREEAKKTQISDVLLKHPFLVKEFDQFKESWNSLEIESFEYRNEILPYIEFDENESLVYFLVDNKEQGRYMAAALLELASIQNRILQELVEVLNTNHDEIRYSIQSLNDEFILSKNIDEDFNRGYSLNNPKYGFGHEIIYDFERIQDNLFIDLSKKKFIDEEKLFFVEYQFELNNVDGKEGGLISVIRKMNPELRMEREVEANVQNFFIEFNEIELKVLLRDLYSSLNRILCILKNIYENPNTTIQKFCNERNFAEINKNLAKKEPLSKIKIENIIQLYEIVEIKYFPIMIESLRENFKSEENFEDVMISVSRFLNDFVCKRNIIEVVDVKNAVLRLIMRCLTDVLEKKHPIRLYLTRHDFWNVDEDKIEVVGEEFPENVELKDAWVTYEAIEKFEENFKKQSKISILPPKIQPKKGKGNIGHKGKKRL